MSDTYRYIVIRRREGEAMSATYRCIVTGNLCGTDTVSAGMECPSTSGKCFHKKAMIDPDVYFGNREEMIARYKAKVSELAEAQRKYGDVLLTQVIDANQRAEKAEAENTALKELLKKARRNVGWPSTHPMTAEIDAAIDAAKEKP